MRMPCAGSGPFQVTLSEIVSPPAVIAAVIAFGPGRSGSQVQLQIPSAQALAGSATPLTVSATLGAVL